MITWQGERLIQLPSLVLPGDIRQRMKLPHVAERAQSLQAGTCSDVPIIRRGKGKWRLVCGDDTIAAHLLLGFPQARCRAVSCSDQEAELLRLTYERDASRSEEQREALLAQLKAMHEQILRDPPKPPSPIRGRRRSTASQAAHEVSKITGLDERQLKRMLRLQGQAEGNGVDPQPAAPTILDLGLPLAPDFVDRVAKIQVRLRGALDGIARARRQLDELHLLPEVAGAGNRDLSAVHTELSANFPFSVCPWCKLLAGVQEVCERCDRRGWISSTQAEEVPDKLWDKLDRYVIQAGSMVRVADLLPNLETKTP